MPYFSGDQHNNNNKEQKEKTSVASPKLNSANVAQVAGPPAEEVDSRKHKSNEVSNGQTGIKKVKETGSGKE